MKHVRFAPGSDVLSPIFIPSCMPLSHLILVLSLLWKPHTNNAFFFLHERSSVPPEDAAIFEGLESLDAAFDALPDSYNGLRPLYQQEPELSSPRSGRTYKHLRPPKTTSLNGLMTEYDLKESSKSHPDRLSCGTETFSLSLLHLLDNDPWSNPKSDSNPGEQHTERGVRSLSASLGASSFNTFQTNEVVSVSRLGATTQFQSMFQSHCSQNQDVSLSQEMLINLQSIEPAASRLKHKNSGPPACSDCFPEHMIPFFAIDQHLPLKNQYDHKCNAIPRQPLNLPERIKAFKKGKASKEDMNLKMGISSQNYKVTSKRMPPAKEGASTRCIALSNKPQSYISPWKHHKSNEQDSEFINSLSNEDPKTRLFAYEKYIQKILPQAEFSGKESFEELRDSMKNKLQLCGGNPRLLYLSLGQKETKDLKSSHCSLWLNFLDIYRNKYRPSIMKWSTNIKIHIRNKIMHQLKVQAGYRRLKELGTYTAMKIYLFEMEQRFFAQAKSSGVMKHVVRSKVMKYMVIVKEATITMLYQIELLLRFSTPLPENYEKLNGEYLLEVLESLNNMWKNFKPFDFNSQNWLGKNVPTKNTFNSPEILRKLHEIFDKRGGDYPIPMRISRVLLSQWCLTKNMKSFYFLKDGLQAKLSHEFFTFMGDCTVYDMVHMIK